MTTLVRYLVTKIQKIKKKFGNKKYNLYINSKFIINLKLNIMKLNLDEQYSELHYLITKEGKRDSKIEKKQLQILKEVLSKIKSYYGDKVSIDFSRFNTKKANNKYRIDRNGVIKKGEYKECGNIWYDSKTFDAIVDFTINGKNYALFFVLKSAQVPGGTQDYAIKEIGYYSKAMQKNCDENLQFMFILDGEYINANVDSLDKSEKYYLSTSETLERALKKYVNSKI